MHKAQHATVETHSNARLRVRYPLPFSARGGVEAVHLLCDTCAGWQVKTILLVLQRKQAQLWHFAMVTAVVLLLQKHVSTITSPAAHTTPQPTSSK